MAATSIRGQAGRCYICGISAIRSLALMGHPICHDCEQLLSSVSCDSAEYAKAIERLKGLWDNRLAYGTRKSAGELTTAESCTLRSFDVPATEE